MSRQKIIKAPPDVTGSPMQRFAQILGRVATAPKELWSKSAKKKRKERSR